MKSKGLGQGLAALLGEEGTPSKEFIRLNPELIHLPKAQPRTLFEDLEGLEASLKHHGILQPLLVCQREGKYYLIAGERRLRAAKNIAMETVPCRILQGDDAEMFEWAILENIQRRDLTPVEEAKSYRHLMELKGYTQDKLAQSLGKSRSYVTNMLRLLVLPPRVQTWIEEDKLSVGQGKLLSGHPQAEALAQDFIQQAMTVRQSAAHMKGMPSPRPYSSATDTPLDPDISPEEEDIHHIAHSLGEALNLKVSLHLKRHQGHVKIYIETLADLEHLLDFFHETL